MAEDLQAGTTRKSGWLSTKNLLTIVVIFGCSAMIISMALYAWSTQKQKTDIGDGGFLSEVPCGPPCFLNIIPGLTQVGEANRIIRAQPFGSSCAETTSVLNCQQIVQIGFQGDQVNMVSFKPANPITVAQAIQKYGPPDRIFVFISSLVPGGHSTSKMRFFYDDLRAMIDLPDQNDAYYVPAPEIALANIAYLSQAEYDSYQQRIGSQAEPWDGYRSYLADVQP